MAPKNDGTVKKGMNKGAWTAEEDRKLSQYIELHGPKRWKTIAIKAGLNRCGKSCRLRWLNYLRPNIKRGNISDEEEDLILRLHRLLGNRWSLIAGRLPGRTDNEIKNYWNSHLSKKLNRQREREEEEEETPSTAQISPSPPKKAPLPLDHPTVTHEITKGSPHKTLPVTDDNIDVNELFDFTTGGSYGLDWVNKFLELDEGAWINEKSKWGRGL